MAEKPQPPPGAPPPKEQPPAGPRLTLHEIASARTPNTVNEMLDQPFTQYQIETVRPIGGGFTLVIIKESNEILLIDKEGRKVKDFRKIAVRRRAWRYKYA